MPPRVTYWTGVWNPRFEAISKEVAFLRQALTRRSPVVSFSAGQASGVRPADGVILLSARRWLTFRILAAAMEPFGALSHAFGAIDAWHLLRGLGRRPLLFTVVLPAAPLPPSLYTKVSVFAVESEALIPPLVAAGVPRQRIRVVYPGVDLREFAPAPPPGAPRFRLLFASSPANSREFEARGVPLLVDVARGNPDVEVVLLWRPWGSLDSARAALRALRLPANVTVDERAPDRMSEVYASVDAVVCFYAAGFGKSCPNSVIESLACGRPVLLADSCGLADLVMQEGGGVVASRDAVALSDGLRRLRDGHARLRDNARETAERVFSLERFRADYAGLYSRLTGDGSAG
jgi:glycosyltransferase involved in cell wall biosynthesis